MSKNKYGTCALCKQENVELRQSHTVNFLIILSGHGKSESATNGLCDGHGIFLTSCKS